MTGYEEVYDGGKGRDGREKRRKEGGDDVKALPFHLSCPASPSLPELHLRSVLIRGGYEEVARGR